MLEKVIGKKRIAEDKEYRLTSFGNLLSKPLAFIDKTPLKYLGSGYWFERYGLKAKELINEFEIKADALAKERNYSGLEDLIFEYRTEIKKNTEKKPMFYWVLTWGISMFVPLFTTCIAPLIIYHVVNDKISTPYIGKLIAGLASTIIPLAGLLTIHDFTSPSYIRKALYYQKNKDERMNRILNITRFDPLKEFELVSQGYKTDSTLH